MLRRKLNFPVSTHAFHAEIPFWGPVQVKVLKSLRRPTLDDVALGQYKARLDKNGEIIDPGYLDDPDVPANSLAPTFAAMALYVDNARWAFLLHWKRSTISWSVGESVEKGMIL
jgi:hypothetical protein